MMNLTLAIPSLNRSSDETLPPLQLAAFNQILRYGHLEKQACLPSEFYSRYLWQGSLLGHAKRHLGIDAQQSAVLASPVWQQMGMHQVSILGGEHLGITQEEAARLCCELTAFYQDDGWRFYPLRKDLWLVTMPSEQDWQVASVLDICGQIGATDQAEGQDALKWLNKQTEIQMWLYSHPVNLARQSQKIPALNGLWLWQDLHGRQRTELLASNSPWAQFYQGERMEMPADFDEYLSRRQTLHTHHSDGLIFLDDLALTRQTGDIWAYQAVLQRWEAQWFAPLWQALATGRLKRLTLATDGENGGELVVTSKSKWAFWKPVQHFSGIW